MMKAVFLRQKRHQINAWGVFVSKPDFVWEAALPKDRTSVSVRLYQHEGKWYDAAHLSTPRGALGWGASAKECFTFDSKHEALEKQLTYLINQLKTFPEATENKKLMKLLVQAYDKFVTKKDFT